MNINLAAGPGPAGIPHRASHAQEVRSPASKADPAAVASADLTRRPATTGHGPHAGGNNVPPADVARKSGPEHDHLQGLARAVERLQDAALKNPQAKGLQHALERLQPSQDARTVDTQA